VEERILTEEKVRAFLEHLGWEEKSSATREKYLRDVERFRLFLGGTSVTREAVSGWKESLVERGYAPRSVNSMLASVNSLLSFLGWQACRTKNLRLQRQTYCAEEKELTRAEYLRLLEAARGRPRLQLALQTICATGIRVSELRCFTVEAVRRGEIRVACKGKTRVILIPGKLRNKLLAYATFVLTSFSDFAMVQETEDGGETDEFTQAQFEEEYAATEEYTLTRPLMLTSDLTLDHRIIVASGGAITVPDGVTVSFSHTLDIQGGAVKVLSGGVLKATEGGWIFVESGTLSIAQGGTFINYNLYTAVSLVLPDGAVEGVAPDEITAQIYAESPSQVVEALAAEAEYRYVNVNINADMELPNLTLAENEWLIVNGEDVTVTIPQGVTVTVPRHVIVSGSLRVAGTLNGAAGGAVSLGDTGKLIVDGGEVIGEIGAMTTSDDPSGVTDRIIGWDPDDLEITITSTGDGAVFWKVRYIRGLTKLAAPTDLEWGLDSMGTSKPGYIRWKPTKPNQGQYRLMVYRAEEDGSATEVYDVYYDLGEMMDQITYMWGGIDYMDLESGTYYFEVTALGDGTTYRNSDTARSGDWVYTKPDRRISAAYTDLAWDELYATAQLNDPEKEGGGYALQFYFAKDENQTPMQIAGTRSYYAREAARDQLWDDLIQTYGAGWYYFRLRVLSTDITVACNGEWSEMSPGYYITPEIEDVKQQLDAITVSEDSTEEEKAAAISAIRAIGAEKLKNAMLADSTVVDRLAKLEQAAAGGPAELEVTPEADSRIEQSKVSVVGANLNVAENSGEPIRLVVDKPQEEHVLPTQFNNSLAVKFSMTLENVANPHALEVPVQVKLPVPASINPNFLVILHYSVAGGEPEQIWPHISYEDGQVYATFVLTSFSDFAMVQETEPEHIPGDVNEDGKVSVKDVTLLAQYLAGWDVSINSDAADVNADGKISVKDVTLLAQYLAGWDVALE